MLIRKHILSLLVLLTVSPLPSVLGQDIPPFSHRSPAQRQEGQLPEDPYTVHNSNDVGHLGPHGTLVYPSDKPSRTLTKTFIVAHLALLGSTVYDVEMTHQGLAHHRCVEQNYSTPFPSRGTMYAKELPLVAAFTVMDLLFQKAHLGIAAYSGAIVGTGKHIYGGTRWATGCW